MLPFSTTECRKPPLWFDTSIMMADPRSSCGAYMLVREAPFPTFLEHKKEAYQT